MRHFSGGLRKSSSLSVASFMARMVESTTARVPQPSGQGFEDIDDTVHEDRIN